MGLSLCWSSEGFSKPVLGNPVGADSQLVGLLLVAPISVEDGLPVSIDPFSARCNLVSLLNAYKRLVLLSAYG